MAMWAVSRSRISPTMITSGSARSIERSPTSKVTPALGAICICLMPAMRCSTGSSIVRMLRSPSLSACSAAYSVVDLPEPVGPVTSTAPLGRWMARSKRSSSAACMPSDVEARRRRAAALVEDAHDDALAVDERQRDHADVDPAAVDGQREASVLGHALLGDVEVGHDLDARDDAHGHPALDGGGGREHAVDAEEHACVALLGVHVDVGGALLDRLGDDRVHELDDRRVAVGLVDGDVALAVLGVLVDDVLDRLVHAREAREQQVEILDGGGGRPDPPAGHHADVVDRQHVRGVGHREQQRRRRR